MVSPLVWKFAVAVHAMAMIAAQAALTLTVDDQQPLFKMNMPYLNFNIDTGSIYNGFDFLDPVLVNLVYALNQNDVNIRIGGTAADYAYFLENSTNPNGGNGQTIISTQILDNIFSFAAQTHANILWDFNGLSFRNQTTKGPWDPTGNATAIMSYLNSKYGGAIEWGWSLGNEPNLWPGSPMNVTQLGQDAKTLQNLVRKFNIGSKVYGPSLGSLDPATVQEYLVASRGFIDGLTVHNYPLARNCNISSYLDNTAVKNLGAQLATIVDLKAKYGDYSIALILEETAGSYGGGCENITDRFASGFYYMPTLGTVAFNGFDRMHRQDIAGWSFTGGMSHYQLVGIPGWTSGSTQLQPHPDWFTSVLFKQLVGSAILNVSVTGDAGLQSTVMMHAWCSGQPWWNDQSIVVTFTNPTGADVTLDVLAGNVSAAPRTEYMLTSSASAYTTSRERAMAGTLLSIDTQMDPPASLSDDAIYLNGVQMIVDSNGILPWPETPVPGRVVTDPTTPIVLPPYSYGFITYPDPLGGSVKAC